MSWNSNIEYPGQITSIFRLFFDDYMVFLSTTLNTKAWKLKLPTDIEYSDPFKEPVSAFLWFIWKRQNLLWKLGSHEATLGWREVLSLWYCLFGSAGQKLITCFQV